MAFIKVKKTKKITFVLIMLLLITINAKNIGSGGDGASYVSFIPSYIEAENNKNLSIEIYCEPGMAIKAWELNIKYDPTVLKAICVEEGDIFEGYLTFYRKVARKPPDSSGG